MSDDKPKNQLDALTLLVQSQERRITKIEDAGQKSTFKKLSENAGACALILGLILTFASLYDVFVTKPAAERIASLSQFNTTVNAAAKIRQELVQAQGQTNDQQLQLNLAMLATPRILNEIATARAIMRELSDEDIGIPQLIILISEAFTSDDKESAKIFINRAIAKKNVPPYYRSEAKRFEGKYLFWTGALTDAREAYRQALQALGDNPLNANARAFVQGELIVLEFTMGDCDQLRDEVAVLTTTLKLPTIQIASRGQIVTTMLNQMRQVPNNRCAIPTELTTL